MKKTIKESVLLMLFMLIPFLMVNNIRGENPSVKPENSESPEISARLKTAEHAEIIVRNIIRK